MSVLFSHSNPTLAFKLEPYFFKDLHVSQITPFLQSPVLSFRHRYTLVGELRRKKEVASGSHVGEKEAASGQMQDESHWERVMPDRVSALRPREERGVSGGCARAKGGVRVGGRGRLVPGQS